MTTATLETSAVEYTDDPDVMHYVCCCTDDIALCGLDVSDLLFVDSNEVAQFVCPLCYVIYEDCVPCPRCGCMGDCGSPLHS